MKIAIVTGEYPPMQGGVGDYSHLIGRAFADLGHQVTVFTSPPAEKVSDGPLQVQPTSSRLWGWRDVLRLRRAIADFDLVNVQYQAAAYGPMQPPIHLLPRLAGPPVVMTYHDLRVPYLFPKAGRLRWQAVLEMARQAAGVIVTNPEDAQTLRQAGGVHQLADIPIGANIDPLPPADYSAAAWRAAHDLPPDAWVLGYFGFLNPSKGGKTLIEALAQLRADGHPAWLVLLGGRTGTADVNTNAAYGDEVDQLAEQLGMSAYIRRTGFLPPSGVTAALMSCDVMLMPYRDGASFRRGTFMACLNHGRATVTTQPTVPLPQLVHGENIWLIPPDDAPAAAQAITHLIAQPDLRAKLGQGANELAQEFTWDKIATQQMTFFEQVLANRGHRHGQSQGGKP